MSDYNFNRANLFTPAQSTLSGESGWGVPARAYGIPGYMPSGTISVLPGYYSSPALEADGIPSGNDRMGSYVTNPSVEASHEEDLELLYSLAGEEILRAVHHYFNFSHTVLYESNGSNETFQEFFAKRAAHKFCIYQRVLGWIARIDPSKALGGASGDMKAESSVKFWHGPYPYPEMEQKSRLAVTISSLVEATAFELEFLNTCRKIREEIGNQTIGRELEEIRNETLGEIALLNQRLAAILTEKSSVEEKPQPELEPIS